MYVEVLLENALGHGTWRKAIGNRSGHRGKVNYDVVALELPAEHMASTGAGVAFYDYPALEKESGVFEL